jgi:hypothetical protein
MVENRDARHIREIADFNAPVKRELPVIFFTGAVSQYEQTFQGILCQAFYSAQLATPVNVFEHP